MQAQSKEVVAVFDFDKTLTDRHTFWRYLVSLVGPIKFWLVAITLVPTAIRLWRKKIALMDAREVMIRRCMTGVSSKNYFEKGQVFAQGAIDPWIRPEALAKLRWHQENNHKCILISNAAESYIEPWSRKMGFCAYSGSRFELSGDKLTGQLIGDHCQGPEKVVRLQQILGPLERYEIYAYGDSSGDKELLEVADHPHYRCF
ncbi:hypothetical protein BIW53_09375 [Pseudoalteromonas byunsanensis]|uniref:Haloacid dehalogenase n=1 Tax=Pseudoalteromonas byunsanensis TaxID=327939 RepID=A0A1S1N9M5_9GAMM|nr:hypothetical protein BIW53_09375 [Pseudoalteromonas byunsanensis]